MVDTSGLRITRFATETIRRGADRQLCLKVDAGGSISACNVAVTDGCRTAGPNAGFVNNGFASQDVFFTSSFTATPSAPGIDGVVGFSTAAATTSTLWQQRSGSTPAARSTCATANAYAADFDMPYTAGASYSIELLTDIVGHTYSVSSTVCRSLATTPFARTSQCTSLANWALISDSAVGALTVCVSGRSLAGHGLHARPRVVHWGRWTGQRAVDGAPCRPTAPNVRHEVVHVAVSSEGSGRKPHTVSAPTAESEISAQFASDVALACCVRKA